MPSRLLSCWRPWSAAGAWVALHWPEGSLRRVVHDSPVESAAVAVGLVLLGVAVVFFATVPRGS